MVGLVQLESISAGSNPMVHDVYHMGHQLGTNIMLMYPNHPSEVCDYFIIVNTLTGERTKVILKYDEMAKDLTCKMCPSRTECEFVDDPYNTNGDCLAIK